MFLTYQLASELKNYFLCYFSSIFTTYFASVCKLMMEQLVMLKFLYKEIKKKIANQIVPIHSLCGWDWFDFIEN